MKRSRNFVPQWSRAKDGKYWREWQAVHKARPDLDRHAFHVEIFGEDKSHVDFTNDDFDAFLGACKAITEPGNLQAQLDALNGRKKRLRFGILAAAAELGVGLDYIDGIVRQMNERGALASSKLDHLDADDLHKVRVALSKAKGRGLVVAEPAGYREQWENPNQPGEEPF
jgi:hypothetical protein